MNINKLLAKKYRLCYTAFKSIILLNLMAEPFLWEISRLTSTEACAFYPTNNKIAWDLGRANTMIL